MQTVLILFSLSFVLSVVTALLLAQAFRPAASEPTSPAPARADPPARFFAGTTGQPFPVAAAGLPVDVLLRQIEQHVRLEIAAAEAFHLRPTAEALHMHTSSPLVH